jgi:hypothetical protein
LQTYVDESVFAAEEAFGLYKDVKPLIEQEDYPAA